jgi:hypothetical protein
VSNLEVTVDDMSQVLGEEVTQLRAAVEWSARQASPGSSSRQ